MWFRFHRVPTIRRSIRLSRRRCSLDRLRTRNVSPPAHGRESRRERADGVRKPGCSASNCEPRCIVEQISGAVGSYGAAAFSRHGGSRSDEGRPRPRFGLFRSGHAARFRWTDDAHQSPYEIHLCVWRIVLGRRGHAGVPVSRSVEPQLTLRDSEAALVPMGLCHGRGDQTTAGSPGKPFFSSTVDTGNRR